MELKWGYPKPGSKEGRNAKSYKVQVWPLVERTFLPHLSHLPSGYTFPSRPVLLNRHSEWKMDPFIFVKMKGTLPGIELRLGFSGFRTTGMENHFNSGPILLFLTREAQSHLFCTFAQYNPEGHNSTDHKQCKIIC